MNPFHTPEEMILFSNLAHWFEGGLLLVVVAVALLQAFGVLKIKTAQIIWSIFVFMAGSFLVPYMLMHHGLDRIDDTWRFIIGDPQQLQHLIMGVLLMLGGLVELFIALNAFREKIWKYVFPAVLAVIGVMFIIHNQHGTAAAIHQSVVYHRYLGSALILTGALKALESSFREKYGWIVYPWIIAMFVTAIMLITYREPKGAYQVIPMQGIETNNTIRHH